MKILGIFIFGIFATHMFFGFVETMGDIVLGDGCYSMIDAVEICDAFCESKGYTTSPQSMQLCGQCECQTPDGIKKFDIGD